jgi:aminomethyltransferase
MRFVFFNDDFHIEDVTAETAVFGIYGPQAKAKHVEAGFPDEALPLHHWRQVTLGEQTAYLHKTDPVCGDGYFVMCMMADKTAVLQQLLSAGISEIDRETFDALRIESGLPRFGAELSLDYIPLETGLWADVSFSKGCYIGQEIIARMESRGKLAKKLVRLRTETAVQVGAEIMASGKKVGSITSASPVPTGGVALGYVKTAVLDENTPLTVDEHSVSVV